jgi:GxxExxY protein
VFTDLEELTHSVIGAAMDVHTAIGPGFLEAIYEEALCVELRHRGIPFERQFAVTMMYRGVEVGRARLDLVIDRRLVVELKAVDAISRVHCAQLHAYLKATQITRGLLLNFNAFSLRDGIKRVVYTPNKPL